MSDFQARWWPDRKSPWWYLLENGFQSVGKWFLLLFFLQDAGKTANRRDDEESQPIPVMTSNQSQLLSGKTPVGVNRNPGMTSFCKMSVISVMWIWDVTFVQIFVSNVTSVFYIFLIINELQNNAVTFMQQKRTKVTMFFVSGGGSNLDLFHDKTTCFLRWAICSCQKWFKKRPNFLPDRLKRQYRLKTARYFYRFSIVSCRPWH